MRLAVACTLFLCLFATASPAQPIRIDLSHALLEPLMSRDTIRIHHLSAAGFAGTFRVDFVWNPVTFTFDPAPTSVLRETSGPDPLFAQTDILRGHWVFAYTLAGATVTEDYRLIAISPEKNSEGSYDILGGDSIGQLVVASYSPADQRWTLLDPGPILDKFYTFLTDGEIVLPGSGCLYLMAPPGSANAHCHPFAGVKQSGTTEAAGSIAGPDRAPPAGVMEQYLRLRGH